MLIISKNIQLNQTMYERLLTGGEITLFSPHDVPGLYEAYFGDAEKFKELYESYERKTSIKKTTSSNICSLTLEKLLESLENNLQL